MRCASGELNLQRPTIPITRDDITRHAFLFDFDGTLAPIAATPEQAVVPAATLEILEQLQSATDGALAIVSGRPIAEIDHLLAPLQLPAAGLHGAQWRGPGSSTVTQIDLDPSPVDAMVAYLRPLVENNPGLHLEHKGLSLALHYRNAADLQSQVIGAAEAAVQPYHDHFTLQPGKMVMEIKPRHASKAGGIERLMAVAPFSGRLAVFAGDDLTDEAGFRAVNRMGGISIKVGEGPTEAAFRLPTPAALAAWLALLV